MKKTEPTTNPVHRKLIDIPEDVFRVLGMKAAASGISLKKYIEQIVIKEANEMDDAKAYRNLIANRKNK